MIVTSNGGFVTPDPVKFVTPLGLIIASVHQNVKLTICPTRIDVSE